MIVVIAGSIITPAAAIAVIATVPIGVVVIATTVILITPVVRRLMPVLAAIAPARILVMSPPRIGTATAGNIDNLARINPIRIQAIMVSNTIGVFVKFPANAEEGIAIADNIVRTTVATAPSWGRCFTFGRNSQLQQNNS